MFSAMKRHDIQVLKRAGHTHSAIGELLGVSTRTVDRVVHEAAVESLEPPEGTAGKRVGRPSKVEAFRKPLQKWLAEDPTVVSVELLRRAKLEGYTGCKSALYALVAELRPAQVEFMFRFEAVPGEFSQHDFGEVKVQYMDGTVERVIFFASRLKYSRWVQVSLVPDQRAETLVRATCDHFAAIGGIPLMAVFDRPRTVALKWSGDGTITQYNPVFAQAMFDMGVGLEVCWPYSPQQKGAVENLVGWVKGSFFKCRRFLNRRDMEAQLEEWLREANEERPSRATGATPASRMPAERARLRPLRVSPQELAIRQPFHVGPTAMVSLEGAQYSMPPDAVGWTGTAFLHAEHVRFEAGKHRAAHRRLATGEKSVLPEHRAARLALVHGRRGKQYLKRQDVLDLGEVALVLLDEIVHRRPRDWYDDIDVLHELLQNHGEGRLRLAMRMAIASEQYSGQAVAHHLIARAVSAAQLEALPC